MREININHFNLENEQKLYALLLKLDRNPSKHLIVGNLANYKQLMRGSDRVRRLMIQLIQYNILELKLK